jgi:Tfp pilus assembly protein PilN
MIKINLLGRKHSAAGAVPFGLDEHFAKLGVSPAELKEMQPGLIRLGVLLGGLYLCNWVPTYLYEKKMRELDVELNQLTAQSSQLSQELASKRDIRQQMDQLNKEEIELQRQLNAVSALQRDRSLAFRTLDNMIVSLPQKVWLSGMEYREKGVVIKGSCWEYFPINDFVKAINESTQYTSVNFKGIVTERQGTLIPGIPEAMQKIKNFELEFKVKGTGDT